MTISIIEPESSFIRYFFVPSSEMYSLYISGGFIIETEFNFFLKSLLKSVMLSKSMTPF